MKLSVLAVFLHSAIIFTLMMVGVKAATQVGLAAAEIAQFGQIDHDPSDEYVRSSTDGHSWEIGSDGYVSYADTSIFGVPGGANPNSIIEQSHRFSVPKTVSFVSSASCLPMGSIGVAIDGIPIYNPFTAESTDAVENESFDTCSGHPDPRGAYHYHQNPDCIQNRDTDTTPNKLLGVALDGVPIYGMYGENGVQLSSADLDDCHGGPLSTTDTRYVYRATRDYPYLVGCFWGEVPNRVLTEGDHCKFAVASDTNGEQGPGGDAGPGEGAGGPESGGTGGGGRPAPPSGGNGGGGRPAPPSGGGGRPAPPSGGGGRPAPPSGGDGGPAPPSGDGGRPAPPSGDGGRPAPPSGGNGGGGRPAPPSGGDGGAPTPEGNGGLPPPRPGRRGPPRRGRRPPPQGGDGGQAPQGADVEGGNEPSRGQPPRRGGRRHRPGK